MPPSCPEPFWGIQHKTIERLSDAGTPHSAYISWPPVLLMQVCCARLWPLSSAKAYPQADVLALLEQALGTGKVIAPHGRNLQALLRTQLQRLHAGLWVELCPGKHEMCGNAEVQRLSSSSRPVARA